MSIARRWKERRESVAREEAGEPEEAPHRPAIGSDLPDEGTPEPERAEQHLAERAEAEAVDLSTLGPGADMSVFLREGVPGALRRQAFRSLWRSSPMFGDFERLNDYDEDFRNPKLVTAVKSAWQAGRGYVFAEEPEASERPTADAAEEGNDETVAEAIDNAPDERMVDAPAPTAITQEPEVEIVENGPGVPSLRERLGV